MTSPDQKALDMLSNLLATISVQKVQKHLQGKDAA